MEFLDYRLIDEKMRGEALEAYKELVQVKPFDYEYGALQCDPGLTFSFEITVGKLKTDVGNGREKLYLN